MITIDKNRDLSQMYDNWSNIESRLLVPDQNRKNDGKIGDYFELDDDSKVHPSFLEEKISVAKQGLTFAPVTFSNSYSPLMFKKASTLFSRCGLDTQFLILGLTRLTPQSLGYHKYSNQDGKTEHEIFVSKYGLVGEPQYTFKESADDPSSLSYAFLLPLNRTNRFHILKHTPLSVIKVAISPNATSNNDGLSLHPCFRYFLRMETDKRTIASIMAGTYESEYMKKTLFSTFSNSKVRVYNGVRRILFSEIPGSKRQLPSTTVPTPSHT